MVSFDSQLCAYEASELVSAQRYRQVLEELIRIPSLSGEEGAVAEWLNYRLRALGITDVVHDEYNNVVASLGSGTGGLLLITYLDTMKPEREMHEPFIPELKEVDGKPAIFGLGAATAKSHLASMIEGLRSILEEFSGALPFALTFAAFSRDLHPTEHGIADLLDRHDIRAEVAIIGEPTGLKLGIGARGYSHIEMCFTGISHHSGRAKHQQNPIIGITAFLERALRQPLPTHSILGEATLTPIEWSHDGQRPQTPEEAVLLVDRRLVPDDPPIQEVVDELVEWADETTGEVEIEARILRHQFPWYVPAGERIISAFVDGFQLVTGEEVQRGPLPFASAAGHLQNVANMNAVAFGGGEITALGPEEHVHLADGVTAARVLASTTVLFAGDTR